MLKYKLVLSLPSITSFACTGKSMSERDIGMRLCLIIRDLKVSYNDVIKEFVKHVISLNTELEQEKQNVVNLNVKVVYFIHCQSYIV